ncbi:MAG: hypothetical protein LBQ79_06100 [Deltaproteobacteria bacterium]|jgi:hypothetical protein|nr:hypothetical protein [Deltaproteobacteria bacterium]
MVTPAPTEAGRATFSGSGLSGPVSRSRFGDVSRDGLGLKAAVILEIGKTSADSPDAADGHVSPRKGKSVISRLSGHAGTALLISRDLF